MRMTVYTRRSFLPPGDEANAVAGWEMPQTSPSWLLEIVMRWSSTAELQKLLLSYGRIIGSSEDAVLQGS